MNCLSKTMTNRNQTRCMNNLTMMIFKVFRKLTLTKTYLKLITLGMINKKMKWKSKSLKNMLWFMGMWKFQRINYQLEKMSIMRIRIINIHTKKINWISNLMSLKRKWMKSEILLKTNKNWHRNCIECRAKSIWLL